MTTTNFAPHQLNSGKLLVDGRGAGWKNRGAVLLEGSSIRAVGAVNAEEGWLFVFEGPNMLVSAYG